MGVFVRVCLAAAILCGLSLMIGSVRAHAAPLEAYGELADVSFVRLSPSGRRFAYATYSGKIRSIVVKDSTGQDKPAYLSLGNNELASLQWAGEQHLVVTTSAVSETNQDFISAKRRFLLAFVFDTASRKSVALQPPAEGGHGAAYSPSALNALNRAPIVRMLGGRPIVFFDVIGFSNNIGSHSLYRYDPLANITQNIAGPKEGQSGFAIGDDGQILAISSYLGKRWTLKLNPYSLNSKTLVLDEPTNPPSLLGPGRRPGTVWVDWPTSGGNSEWREISVTDGVLADDLTAVQKQSSPIIDPETGMVIGVDGETGEAFYDAEFQKFWSAIVKAFGSERVNFSTMTRDRSRLIVSVYGANNGYSFLAVDRATRHADPIADVYRGITPDDIVMERATSYPAADGLQIPAYLTLPNGRPGKGLPLIVIPHPNADGRSGGGYEWLTQAFVSRGYAVLQPQYRGSSGHGDAFLAAGYGEWGGKMQSDLSDGVRTLAGQGVIDPKRVCIVGISYGGFAALTGVTGETGIYRCAVSINGITDLKKYMEIIRNRTLQRGGPLVRQWERLLGATPGGDPVNAGLSPALNAGKASAPILLVEGTETTDVPPSQSQAMADALQKAGKPHELIILKGEDQTFGHLETRQQALQAVVHFLEANNPPDPAQTAAAAQIH